ncbi:hypothetical protein DMC30DRAFT_350011 [Rhodotorula diobovata]|uniref:Large ribosomal subunit protein bL32m n=1 Tax=Rhodotorula diobovata TaxID=5288 RepID=A0A5C5FYE9_9BASI|nr:hypothetical protein DMC30DRAFT_350011 [Rhodotorula diobovata]
MASLALPTLRTTRRAVHQVAASLTPSVSLDLSFSLAPTRTAAPAPSALATLAARLIPDSLAAGLRELLPPWVFAVPKRRTTHGAKRMRASNKGLKEKQNLVSCPSCGAPKLAHHLCHGCHVAFRRELHREAKEAKAGLAPEQRV